MTAFDHNKLRPLTVFLLGFLVLMATLGLGYLDHETKNIQDLFTRQNIAALFLYFLPAFSLSLVFLHYFKKRKKGVALVLYSFFSGTLLGFGFTMIVLYLMLKKQMPYDV